MYKITEIYKHEKTPVGKFDSLKETYEGFLKFCFGSENIFNEEKGFFICGEWIWPEEDDDIYDDPYCIHVPSLEEIEMEIIKNGKYIFKHGDNCVSILIKRS